MNNGDKTEKQQDDSNADQNKGLEYLEDWPYIPFYLQSTLDHKMIERHGEAILSRALNLGRVVAFVGSGVSMSYGRLSWKSLVRALAEDAKAQARPHNGKKGASAQRARDTLNALDIGGRSLGGELQSGRYPAAFQFCEQLLIANKKEQGRKDFRKKVKQLLFDDAGQAKILMDGLFQDCVRLSVLEGEAGDRVVENCKSATDMWLERVQKKLTTASLHERHDSHEDEAWREAFTIERFDSGKPWFPDEKQPFPCQGVPLSSDFQSSALASLLGPRILAERLVEAVCRKAGRETLGRLPLHRFLVVAIARLAIPVFDKGAGSDGQDKSETYCKRVRDFLGTGAGPERRGPSDRDGSERGAGSTQSSIRRTHFVPPERDPLAILADRLKIGRYITTNFDLDIERLIRDRGFVPDASENGTARPDADGIGIRTLPPNESISPLGATATDTVFRTKKAADLIDFAINDTTNAFTLMHLHGRATEDDDLVVTERDYLDLYLRRGPDGEVVNDALEIGFGSNPLLFVGNGMGEDDILRPLRQFVSDRTSGSDRQVIALLPALGSRAQMIEETIAIYSRYGAHTIHFGYADLVRTDGTKAEHIRWLAHALKLIGELKGIFENLNDTFLKYNDCFKKIKAIRDREGDKISKNAQKDIDSQHKEFFSKLKNFEERVTAFLSDCSNEYRGRRGKEKREHWSDVIERNPAGSINLCKIEKLENLVIDQISGRGQGIFKILEPTLEFNVIESAIRSISLLPGHLFKEKKAEIINFPKQEDPDDRVATMVRAWRRVALAYIAALDGLPDALIGLSLCAKLNGLHRGWMDWKAGWHALPAPRLTGGPMHALAFEDDTKDPPSDPSSPSRLLYVRHPIALRDLNAARGLELSGDHGDRFFTGATSQMFGSFLSALEAARDNPSLALNRSPAIAGRRIFVLLAPRGAGKGEFFESLRDPKRIKKFLDASWPRGEAPPYMAVAVLNLRFSTEFTSAFDRLANILVHSSARVFQRAGAEPLKRIVAAGRELERNRIGKLTRLLELYSEFHMEASGRILIALNAVEVLFNNDGLPKTGQAARLIEALLSKKAGRAPIDMMLICGSSVPIMFRNTDLDRSRSEAGNEFCVVGSIPLEHLVRTDLDEEGRRKLAKILRGYKIHDVSGESMSGDFRLRPTQPYNPSAFFHVLHETRASLVVGTYFPLVALALAAQPGVLSSLASELQRGIRVPLHFTHQRLISRTIVDMIRVFDYNIKEICRIIRETYLRSSEEIGKLNESDPALDGRLKVILSRSSFKGGFFEKEPVEFPQDETPSSEKFNSDLKHLFELCGKNRFVLSIACAAADEAAWVDSRADKRPEFDADGIVRWFKDAWRHMLGTPRYARSEQMIGYVLQFYATRHDAAMPLPAACQVEAALKQRMRKENKALHTDIKGNVDSIAHDFAEKLSGPDGWRLQQTILWHLGVCSNPLTADVLAAAPKIRTLCEDIINDVQRPIAAANASERKAADANKVASDRRNDMNVAQNKVISCRARHAELLDYNIKLKYLKKLLDEKAADQIAIVSEMVAQAEKQADSAKKALSDAEKEESTASAAVEAAEEAVKEAEDQNRKDKDEVENAEARKTPRCVVLIQAALDILVHRCLVFRLQEGPTRSADALVNRSEPGNWSFEPNSTPDTPEPLWRFTLHRLMQRSIYRRLHAPTVEPTAVDQYTLSLYGTLPNDLPKPRAEAVRDLDALLSAWTGFPKDPAAINDKSPYHRAAERAEGAEPGSPVKTLPSRMLRAAFGVVRSVYSVGVVSRFDDFGDWNGPACGHFEEHRLQIRWLLKKAVALSYEDKKRPYVYSGAAFKEDDPGTPFFAEEIVWLYNECGLLSLIEGRLNDAKALFEQALAAALRIEPESEHGPLWSRLMLNKSIVDMERGRVSTAREQLLIVAARPNEHPVIGAVANGYLGVCAHINGDFETAKAKYLGSIESLRTSGHSRGVAIFSRHLADLYRAWSPDFMSEAYRAAEQAISHAEKGGHEDVRQFARLSRVRLDIHKFPPNLQENGIQTELDDLERYAEVMGLPRLLCEVLYARASFLLLIGETRHAASLARRCLQQATMNDLKLRQVSTLGLLANIYQKRGLRDAAKPLFDRAQDFATLCNYRSARSAATGRSNGFN